MPDEKWFAQFKPTHAHIINRIFMRTFTLQARLAMRLGLHLNELKPLFEAAVFGLAQRDGLKIKTIAFILGVSSSKANQLSRQYKHYSVFQEATVYTPAHQILLLLSAIGHPLTRKQLIQALSRHGAKSGDIEAALDTLLIEGRVAQANHQTPAYYTIGTLDNRADEDQWLALLAGLSSTMEALANIVQARLVDGDERAFARTLTYQIRPEDLPRLTEHYASQLIPLIQELHKRAEQHEDAISMRSVVAWSPSLDHSTL